MFSCFMLYVLFCLDSLFSSIKTRRFTFSRGVQRRTSTERQVQCLPPLKVDKGLGSLIKFPSQHSDINHFTIRLASEFPLVVAQQITLYFTPSCCHCGRFHSIYLLSSEYNLNYYDSAFLCHALTSIHQFDVSIPELSLYSLAFQVLKNYLNTKSRCRLFF